jgi:hypothetical protein
VRPERPYIDLDKPTTWPEPVAAWVRHFIDRGQSIDAMSTELIEREDELRSLLGSEKLLAYHCTRLLDSEVAAIRERGLRRLSPELVAERLRAASDGGHLTDDELDRLAARTVFALGEQEHREGQVCLILGRSVLDDGHGCAPLLRTWGGEGIYWGARAELEDRLVQIGRPAIAVVRIEVRDGERAWTYSLGSHFVARLRGDSPGADLFYRDDVPAEDVLDFWQPGDSEYDRHQALPQ